MAAQVNVRMYRAGLGDCFLLSFRDGDQEAFHALIDCGVFLNTPGEEQKMKQVAADIQAATDGHLHLLVVTHEHYDHLSGFLHGQQTFRAMKIDRIWFAWTEDPQNETARLLRAAREKKVALLRQFVAGAARNLAANSPLQPGVQKIDYVLQFFGAKGNATAEALAFLKQDIDAPIEYLYPGQRPVVLPGLPGVRFYVLGPPQDVKAINKSRPSKARPEVYHLADELDEDVFALQAVLGAWGEKPELAEAADNYLPFDEQYRMKPEAAQQDGFFQQHYGFSNQHQSHWRNIDAEWLQVGSKLALQLDDATNNTSLVLAIELIDSGKVLLFPGDAQVGNWLSWGQYSWKGTASDGTATTVTSADLLARTVLYKVGHHGSHNATLRDQGLELMTHPDLTALIPVDEAFAKTKSPPATGWQMPFGPLMQRLQERTKGRIIRLDQTFPLAEDDVKPPALTQREWQRFRNSCQVTNLYWNYTLNLD